MLTKIKIFTALSVLTLVLTGCGTGFIDAAPETSPPKIENPDSAGGESNDKNADESDQDIPIKPVDFVEDAWPEVRETPDGTVAYLIKDGQVAGIYAYFARGADDAPMSIRESVITNGGKTLKITTSGSYAPPSPEDVTACQIYTYVFDGAEKITSVRGADHSCTIPAEEVDWD